MIKYSAVIIIYVLPIIIGALFYTDKNEKI